MNKTMSVSGRRIPVPGLISGGSFHLLLGLLVVLYALAPFLHGSVASIAKKIVWIVLLMSAVGAVASTRRALVWGALLVTALAIGSDVTDHALGASTIIGKGMRALLVLFVTVVITNRVFAQQRVTARTISGSICIFLLMGLLWSTVYGLVEQLAPGSFRGLPDVAGLDPQARAEALNAALAYYSHVTLTTLGYGDVVPVSSLARTLSTLEAISGQIYLVVAVSRLVGLHIASERTRRDRGDV